MTDQQQKDNPEIDTCRIPKTESSFEVRTATGVSADIPKPFQCVEEEYTVEVPLVRPKPEFLSILKLGGASGEIFTKKEIVQYLRNYISSRNLYDPKDPRVVYCDNDPLGKVFNVNKFTVFDVLNFLSIHCTEVPDTCRKKKHRLVSRPISYQLSTTSQNQSACFTISVCQASPVITSTSGDLKQRKTVSTSQRKSSSSSSGSSKKKEIQSVNQSSLAQGPKEEHNRSKSAGGHSPNDSKQSEDTTVAEESQTKKKNRNRKKRKRKNGQEGSSSPNQGNDPADEPGPSSRKRGTSLSITYNDTDDSAYPWYFQVQVQDKGDDESEVLSIQDKTTATVHDSTDDLWFVEEESFEVAMHSDDEFSVEYDIESDNSPLTESDISSVKSGEGLLVVCKESDVEFFADYSDSDSEETEFTEADKWMCLECKHHNLPLQRYCDACWKLRPGWLPDLSRSAAKKNINQSEDGAKIVHKDISDDKIDKDAAKLGSSFNEINSAIGDTADFDSGVGGLSSSFQSSQETGKSNLFSNSQEVVTPALKLPREKVLEKEVLPVTKKTTSKEKSLFHDMQETEVRYTLSNFQSRSSSLESFESEKQEKNTEGKLPASVSELCMICLSKPKSASLVHGSSGHQVCCFPCGKRLKRRGKVCPVCRRPIQKVIKNFVL